MRGISCADRALPEHVHRVASVNFVAAWCTLPRRNDPQTVRLTGQFSDDIHLVEQCELGAAGLALSNAQTFGCPLVYSQPGAGHVAAGTMAQKALMIVCEHQRF